MPIRSVLSANSVFIARMNACASSTDCTRSTVQMKRLRSITNSARCRSRGTL
jgi:hypothetical protein